MRSAGSCLWWISGAPSGFSWLRFGKTELQLYNIRHIQHHAGQLTDRLRTAAGIGVRWVAAI